ncbi:MAG: A/G-specific adenine glycosylase, partial [Flavobacteriales bacterium]|nr:A/G-specific adenine glycosylase [Flavobacteriales bacterium]
MGKSKSSKSIRKKEIVSTQFPVAQNLLKWYDRNRRDLPWRESTDPYRVWLSEIMLQQTRVNQAIDYYFRFLKAFPRIEDLADAREQVVLKLWQGLGYYSRARNLHGAAKQVVNEYGGVFPSKYHEIKSLKGVGPYTAAAIGSISFGIPEPAVDGNALRVMSRFFGIHTPVNSPAGFNQVKEKMLSVIDQQRPGDFNQAVMELGATLCAPRNPDCAHCPLSSGCLANANQLTDVLPVKKAKKPPVSVQLRYLVVQYNDKVYLRQRGTGAIWANMFDFPELSAGESG